jgi:quinol monooxygenase YgiN
VIAVLRFHPPADPAGFFEQGRAALAALAARPGFVRGSLGRATDDDTAWALISEWESVGAYRRGIGGYEIKMMTPFFAQVIDEPSAFETLATVSGGGAVEVRSSDRASDADTAGRQ